MTTSVSLWTHIENEDEEAAYCERVVQFVKDNNLNGSLSSPSGSKSFTNGEVV